MSDAAGAPGPPGPAGNLPRRDTGFAGRSAELDLIRAALETRGRAVVRPRDTMAGAGTTALVLEYAHRAAAGYRMTWLVPAGRTELIGGHLAQAAHAAGLVAADVTVPAAVQAIHAATAAGARWLLIFDDVADPAHLDGWAPPDGGHVLITSRQPGGTAIDVGPLRREESVELLRAGLPVLSAEAADRLAGALGDLPPAVALLARYGLAPGDLVDRLDRPGHRSAISLAIDRLEHEHPAAAQLLCLCAVLAPAPIPPGLIAGSLARLPGPLGTLDPAELGALAGVLTSFGLADGLHTHRLVRSVVLGQLGEAAARVCREYAGTLVTAALPDEVEDPATWPEWTALAPHLLAADPAGSSDPAVRAAAGRLVQCLLRRAELPAALTIATDLHTSWLRLLGPDHPDTLAAATTLAHIRQARGEIRAAEEIVVDALPRCRATLGDDHPDTLRCAGELATVQTWLGAYADARELHQETHARRAKILGPDHPDTLRSAQALSNSWYGLGELAVAEALQEDTLDRCRRTLGPDHPDTLRSLDGLAVIRAALGETATAARLGEDTLDRRRRVLGDRHPETLAAEYHLATVRYELGDRTTARRLHRKVFEQRTAVLGPDHPATLLSAHAVAAAMYSAGAVLPARTLLDDTLARLARTLGPDHPQTARVRESRRRATRRVGSPKAGRRKGRRS